MTHWRPTDRGILTLPSGHTVRGRGLSADPESSPDPEFGLYLLASPPADRPSWDHIWVEWTDFGLPVDPAGAGEALRSAWRRAADERVEIACLGGLGRTGTALACLAVLDGLSAAAAIALVRDRYDVRAIETPEQLDFVKEFAAGQFSATTPARGADERASRAVRVSAYAACVHDGAILLSHQVSSGPAQDKWTLPGGGVHFGEDPATAAARECREETALSPTIGPVLAIHSDTYTATDGVEWHGIRILFAGTFTGARPDPTSPDDGEIDGVGWFPLDDLPVPITEWASLAARASRG